jgi:tyrosyl-tRNA synthetase
MGKTEKGALWLDPEKTTPYEFFQYLRNVQDSDVINALKMLTFIDINEIDELAKLKGAELNHAKELLAYEVTKIVHGEAEAVKARQVSRQLFEKNSFSDNMPIFELQKNNLPVNIVDLCMLCGLLPSKSETKRLIGQGGLFINDDPVLSFDMELTSDKFINNGMAILRKGKKTFIGIKPVE